MTVEDLVDVIVCSQLETDLDAIEDDESIMNHMHTIHEALYGLGIATHHIDPMEVAIHTFTEEDNSPSEVVHMADSFVDKAINFGKDVSRDEDGIRVGDIFFWYNRDYEDGDPPFFKGSWKLAKTGVEDDIVDSSYEEVITAINRL